MKYLVNIEEVLTRDVVVDAENEEDAEIKVKHLYRDEEIVLDYDDFIGQPTIRCIQRCNETVDRT
jgi:hypothetical protein